MADWNDRDYDRLFESHPPTQPTAPTAAECAALGLKLGRSRGAVHAQWEDGRSAVLRKQSAASEHLRDYLRRRGWM
jgi:hypothetical protein